MIYHKRTRKRLDAVYKQIVYTLKTSRLWTLFVLVLVFFAGCTPKPSPPFRIGTTTWVGYEPLFLARNLGYFDDTNIQLIEYPTTTEVSRAWRNGAIEAGTLTVYEVLLLAESGLNPSVILVLDISDGADVILGKPELDSLADLKGRRVGLENSAVAPYLLSRALQSINLTVADLEIVSLKADEHENAFAEDKVVALVTYEPFSSRLLAAGASHLFDSSEIPNEIVDVLFVHSYNLEEQPEQVKILLTGWFRALDYLEKEPGDATQHIAQRTGLSNEVFLASLKGLRLAGMEENRTLLVGQPPPLLTATQRMIEILLEQRLLRQEIDLAPLFAKQLLEEVAP